MLIAIHALQNHSPANLNRDDLGAPKTCHFGGVLRSRISSQCLKRSIRMSGEFKALLGGVRTRQLAGLIAERLTGKPDARKRAAKILESCGIAPKDEKRSDMLVYTTREAVAKMAELLNADDAKDDATLAKRFGELLSSCVKAPDMALCGRMLETGVLADTTVEAALQVAHAISTHEARPEIDYYVAADDIPGDDAGAGYVDEAVFASACFYKYFSIHWETLLANLGGDGDLAAHTVGAFLRGSALATPSGKQNSFAAHNPPDGILVEFRDSPISYANAFAMPARAGERDLVAQSVAQLANYVGDLDAGFGKPADGDRFWFSPNLRHPLLAIEGGKEKVLVADDRSFRAFDDLVSAVVRRIGFDWEAVRKTVAATVVS